MLHFRMALALSLTPLFSSCVSARRESQVKVIDGETPAADDPLARSTMLLTKGERFTCTGTLIAPRLVLTAAHCKMAAGDKAQIGNLDDPNKVQFAIEQALRPACWDDDTAEFDIAVLKLATPVPSDLAAPVRVHAAGDAPLQVGDAVFTYGFGMTNRKDKNSVGKLQRTAQKILTLDYSPRLVVMQSADGDAAKSICNGDSGGPSYRIVGDKIEVVAATDFSGRDYDCGYWFAGARVQYYADWIAAADKRLLEDPNAPLPVMDCGKLLVESALPPPYQDELRGPKQCRLSIGEKLEEVHQRVVTGAYRVTSIENGDPIGTGLPSLVFSAPSTTKRIELCIRPTGQGECGVGGNDVINLAPSKTGKGRSCFAHMFVNGPAGGTYWVRAFDETGALQDSRSGPLRLPEETSNLRYEPGIKESDLAGMTVGDVIPILTFADE